MPEIDDNFLASLERQHATEKKRGQVRKRILVTVSVLGLLALAGGGAYYLVQESQETRALPAELPPPSPQPTLPVSEQAKETGKGYYLAHPEIQSALAEYARQLLKGEMELQQLGPLFQPIQEVSWDKWYYDTVPVEGGFKTLKESKPSPHPFVEHHLITYTIQPDDRWGAWGVGIKYAAALGVDITNPADKEIASLVAAYVWLQAENRLLYDKTNYFDKAGEFDPKRPRRDINRLHAGDEIRFPHLSPEALKEIVQRPAKYLEATVLPGEEAAPAMPTP